MVAVKANAPKRTGRVQVYTGDGKGKTTAAIGLAVRAAGHGLRTYVGQFLKGLPYGELTALRDHPLITIEQYGTRQCLRREDIAEEDRERARDGLEHGRAALASGRYDLVVLDEINVAVWFGLVSNDEVVALIDGRPAAVELVLTGRYAPADVMARADLVTEMREVKHYFRDGVPAREGIER
jgi:cob(I)alamin adenosyltransferase